MLSEGVERREAIPIVPEVSYDTGYYGIPTTHDKGGYDMQQWNATVASGLVAGVCNHANVCNFLCVTF